MSRSQGFVLVLLAMLAADRLELVPSWGVLLLLAALCLDLTSKS